MNARFSCEGASSQYGVAPVVALNSYRKRRRTANTIASIHPSQSLFLKNLMNSACTLNHESNVDLDGFNYPFLHDVNLHQMSLVSDVD